jgi:hypothetical protein
MAFLPGMITDFAAAEQAELPKLCERTGDEITLSGLRFDAHRGGDSAPKYCHKEAPKNQWSTFGRLGSPWDGFLSGSMLDVGEDTVAAFPVQL